VIGVLASLASFKKAMPEPCKCSLRKLKKEFIDNAREVFSVPADYLAYVEKESRSIFKAGWDKGYGQRVVANSAPLSACTEATRSELGAFSMISRAELSDLALGKATIDAGQQCELVSLVTAGKPRILVKTPASWNGLRPLHQSLYDHISTKEWLLRGPPTLKRLQKLTKGMKRNERMLSGDYQSATDNLSIEVAEVILRAARASSSEVPDVVWESALKTLRPFINSKERIWKGGEFQGTDSFAFRLKRGQMMGSLLSFPLLCVQNRIATTYIMGRRPMLINGDDLLTRCSPAEYGSWLKGMESLGLTPSRAKTGYLRSFFTINSCFFKLQGRNVRRVPAFRGKGFVKSEGNPIPTGNTMSESRGALRGVERVNFEAAFLETHAKTICSSRRSMGRLGLAPSPAAVPRWLAVREWTLQGLGFVEKKLPAPPSSHGVGGVPLGWKFVRRSWVRKHYPERADLVESAQVDVWLDGKESLRDEAKGGQEWSDWWNEVRCTGVLPPPRMTRVGVSTCLTESFFARRKVEVGNVVALSALPYQCVPTYRPHWLIFEPEEKRFWSPRVKAKSIGPILRDLLKKKVERADEELLVPESWHARRVHFSRKVEHGTPFSNLFNKWMFSLKNI
jgi:hypothetical protein